MSDQDTPAHRLALLSALCAYLDEEDAADVAAAIVASPDGVAIWATEFWKVVDQQ